MLHHTILRTAKGLAIAACVLAIAACGGGSDTPSAPSTTQVLLSDGDTLADGFKIDTIESANLANDRTVAFIASRPGPPTENAAYVRDPGGNITGILTPSSPIPPGLSLETMRNLAISESGDVTFEIGSQLDDDALFLYSGGQLHLVARTEPGSTPPGFRVVGERRIANGGQVAFSYGVSPCNVDTSGGDERITCALRVVGGTADSIQEISVPNDLASETTSAVTVIMHDNGQLVLGLPASGSGSLVGTVVNGQYQSVLSRRQVLPGLGTVLSATPRAINASGALVVDARLDTDGDGQVDKTHVLLLANGGVTSVAETGVPAGTKVILTVRGNGIDDRGRVLLTATFGDPGETTGSQSLRLWDAGTTREIAFEGQPFGQDDQGNDTKILDVEQVRIAGNGDVIFRGTIGFLEDNTRHVTESRIFRQTDDVGSTLLTTGTKVSTGTIVEINIADVNDNGDVLVIAGVNRRADRGLLLLPRL